jgi:hypothetical protein
MDNETKDIQLMRAAMDHCVEVAQQSALAELAMYAGAKLNDVEIAWLMSCDAGWVN